MLFKKEEAAFYLGQHEKMEEIKKEVEDSKSKSPSPNTEEKITRNEFIKEAGFSGDEMVGLERIISTNDLMGVNYLSRGLRASKAVGRVVIYGPNGKPLGYGTGFMISPRLMITNNHVLPDIETAGASSFQLDYEVNIYGQLKNFSEFKLAPGEFFHTFKNLDFSIVAVNNKPVNNKQRVLEEFGWLKIYRETGKVLEYEFLTIVQHPSGEPKQIALRENKLIKVLDNSLRYTTDTAPGSSGSCVFNDQWQVVALHNMGVPEMVGNKYVTVDGRKVTADQIKDEREIKWIANQGIRISKIIENITSIKDNSYIDELFQRNILFSTTDFNKYMDELNRRIQESYRNRKVYQPATDSPAVGEMTHLKTSEIMDNNKLRVTIPLTIEIGIGNAGTGNLVYQPTASPAAPGTSSSAAAGFDGAEEAIKIDPDYKNREGYQPRFLDEGKLNIKLPVLSAAMKKNVATLKSDSKKYVLDYHHYSVVMNKVKRMPFFTAVNIDGASSVSINRKSQGGDKWFQDPRISPEQQLNDDIYYKNKLDRGHMVRREEPNWGSQSDAIKANSDTFHHTNAAPQHAELNQKTWLMLEEYLLNYARNNDERMCIFTGPIFSTQDPVYREGIRLPLQFFKVAVYMKEGKLQSVAYLRSQQEWIDDLEKMRIDEEEIKTWQVPVKQVEKLTGLKFDAAVVKADRYKAGGVTLSEAMRKENRAAGKVPIKSEGDIDL